MSPPDNNLPVRRTRVAIVLVSAVVIALELALMRMGSLRFWSHFAYMVISVAILGFGASGTVLTLSRRWILKAPRGLMSLLAFGFALSIPLVSIAARAIPLDVQFLAWDLSQGIGVAALEALMFVPFFLSGMFVGIALMDSPQRIAGHYAANLAGSGLGAVGGVVAMMLAPSHMMFGWTAVVALAAGLILLTPRKWTVAGAIAAAVCVLVLAVPPLHLPRLSQYKMLPQMLAIPGTESIHHDEGPLGRIDVVSGPGIHYAPGLSLQYTAPIPPHVLLIVDGDQTSAVYDCRRVADFAFADQTTSALAYQLKDQPSVLVLGAGGGVDIGLAIYHDTERIVALEMNEQIIEAMTGPLAQRGGNIFAHPRVTLAAREAREYLASSSERFDVIQFPPIDAFGASGAGLYAAQESYLYTLEAFSLMMDRLGDSGLLSITRWGRTPPRDALKVFDTAAEMLRRRRMDPAKHLAVIRNWATVTVLVSVKPLDEASSRRIREFCETRGFDLCYLPNLTAAEANRFHVLESPVYFEACDKLLGSERTEYLQDHLFNIAAATDDRPYFFHFLRKRSLPILRE
ncbi:MAG: spermidine synthase family protein, partial [Planctomycetota bacterium]